MEHTFHEMKKKNVSLMLLWEEYKDKHPDGIMYTQFCDRYRKFKKQNNLSMHKEHKAGEEVEVDWAGSTMSYIDPGTGEERTAYIFVSVLPASSYPFAYAYGDMKLPSWIDTHVRAYSTTEASLKLPFGARDSSSGNTMSTNSLCEAYVWP